MADSAVSMAELRAEEYDIQACDLSPRQLLTHVQLTAEETLTEHISFLKDFLLRKAVSSNENKKGLDPVEAKAIKSACSQIHQRYECLFKKNLKHFKPVLDKFFHVPEHVLLPEDACQRKQYSKEEVDKIDFQIHQLQISIKKKRFMIACLQEEMKAIVSTKQIATKALGKRNMLIGYCKKLKNAEILVTKLKSEVLKPSKDILKKEEQVLGVRKVKYDSQLRECFHSMKNE